VMEKARRYVLLVYVALLSHTSGLQTSMAPACLALARGHRLSSPRCPSSSLLRVFRARGFEGCRAEGAQDKPPRRPHGTTRKSTPYSWGSGRGAGRAHGTADALSSAQAQPWEQPPPDDVDLSVYYRARISYCTRRRARAVSTISAVDLLIEDLPEFNVVEVAGTLVRAHKCLLGVVAHPRAGLRQQRAAWDANRRYDLSLVVCSDAFLSRMNAEWRGRGVADESSALDEAAGRRGRAWSPDGDGRRGEEDVKWLCFPQMTKGGMVGDLLVSYEAAVRSARPSAMHGHRAADDDEWVKLEIWRQLIRTVLEGLVSLLDISEGEEQRMAPYVHDILGDDSVSRDFQIALSQRAERGLRGRRGGGARGRGRAGWRAGAAGGRGGGPRRSGGWMGGGGRGRGRGPSETEREADRETSRYRASHTSHSPPVDSTDTPRPLA
jgi:hypothetical protein